MSLVTSPREVGAFATPYGWLVRAHREVEYPVAWNPALLETDATYLASIDPALADTAAGRKWLVFIDSAVDAEYGTRIRAWLAQQRYRDLAVYVNSLRESDKNLGTIDQIHDVIAVERLRRRDQVVVIGGGVFCDTYGYAAASWEKYTPAWMVPTTVTAAFDAGPAGKRAVNHVTLTRKSKNAKGTYANPEAVFVSDTWFPTVPHDDVTGGAAEMVKVAVVCDEDLFRNLEHNGPAMLADCFQSSASRTGPASEAALCAAIRGTIHLLALDYFEKRLQRLLDHAHDFAGALEMELLDRLPHGHAVAINLAWAATLSALRGRLAPSDRDRILRTLVGLGCPITHEALTPEVLWRGLEGAADHRDGLQSIPIVVEIGKHVEYVSDLTQPEAEETLSEHNDHAARIVASFR